MGRSWGWGRETETGKITPGGGASEPVEEEHFFLGRGGEGSARNMT